MSVCQLMRDAEILEPTETAMPDHLLNARTRQWSCSHTVLPGDRQLVNERLLCAWPALDYPDKVHVSGKKAENQIYFLFKKYFVLQNIKRIL